MVAKASLTADMGYPLLAYAAEHPALPRDTTSDQTPMGRLLGTAAAATMAPLLGPDPLRPRHHYFPMTTGGSRPTV